MFCRATVCDIFNRQRACVRSCRCAPGSPSAGAYAPVQAQPSTDVCYDLFFYDAILCRYRTAQQLRRMIAMLKSRLDPYLSRSEVVHQLKLLRAANPEFSRLWDVITPSEAGTSVWDMACQFSRSVGGTQIFWICTPSGLPISPTGGSRSYALRRPTGQQCGSCRRNRGKSCWERASNAALHRSSNCLKVMSRSGQ